MKANPYVSSRAMLSELRFLIRLATGEAMRRAERAGCRVEVPGIPSITPPPLIEDLAS